mmetsp:Transcript_24667/g.78106  ORF Transcript_24667/g.78106 Transcript_24667/m.78106 type:complete len:200 (+) Transcript_24667:398-997(+)
MLWESAAACKSASFASPNNCSFRWTSFAARRAAKHQPREPLEASTASTPSARMRAAFTAISRVNSWPWSSSGRCAPSAVGAVGTQAFAVELNRTRGGGAVDDVGGGGIAGCGTAERRSFSSASIALSAPWSESILARTTPVFQAGGPPWGACSRSTESESPPSEASVDTSAATEQPSSVDVSPQYSDLGDVFLEPPPFA